MEVYFKQLISKDASLDKLVDDLERVVQGADDFAKSLGDKLAERPEIRTLVAKLVHGEPDLMAVETFNKPARVGSGASIIDSSICVMRFTSVI